MSIALVFNPGSASLKFEVIEMAADQESGQVLASEGRKRVSAAIEGIGRKARLLVFDGRKIAREEPCDVADMIGGAGYALNWLGGEAAVSLMKELSFVAVRVVHGGEKYAGAVRFTAEVKRDVEALEDLAPLHNENSLKILSVLERQLAEVPVLVTFDTAFHRSLPEVAWRYPIERATADELGIRRFGFHGLSHRYMVEQYARAAGKDAKDVSIVTLHLESGCSAAAIAKGRSVDTTMGMTPLEGLMMGTRSGSIDPAILPYLMRKRKMSADEVLTFLNRKCGLLGIAGGTFDTRELVKRRDDDAKLALEMFSYRVRMAVGAYLAALGDAEAVVFGGGIGEDTPSVRAQVCAGLRGWGLLLDEEVNARSTAGQACISRADSALKAYVIPVEEGLQIAHECCRALRTRQSGLYADSDELIL